MTFGNIGLSSPREKSFLSWSSQTIAWYLVGCATALPDFWWKYNGKPTWNMCLDPLKVPLMIPVIFAVYTACFFLSKRCEVAIRAVFLGAITGLGILISFYAHSSYKGFGLYIVFLSWFHFSEYFFTERYNPEKVKLSSFMLNHSPAYNIALTCSIIEFLVERYYYPGWKERLDVIGLGFALCIFGEVIRKRAMSVAGPNFNHLVQCDLTKESHNLITNDIYGIIQHPSYTGWFIFTIGTQVTLCNPLCSVFFPIVMYGFFENRVKIEEPALEKKHGTTYIEYKNNTARFIPRLW